MNPVHKDDATGMWWFWDETWGFRYGPYPDEQTANKMCNAYAQYLDTGEPWQDSTL